MLVSGQNQQKKQASKTSCSGGKGTHVLDLVSSVLTSLASRCVTRVLRWSMVSCMALTRRRSVSFSLCSMAFSWYRSLKPSEPSSQATRFPCSESQRKTSFLVHTHTLTINKKSHYLVTLRIWKLVTSRKQKDSVLKMRFQSGIIIRSNCYITVN